MKMTRMTVPVALGLLLAIGLGGGALAAPPENGTFSADLLYAESLVDDEVTGGFESRTVDVARRRGEEPQIFTYGGRYTPLDCEPGAFLTRHFFGFGPATLELAGGYETGRATAVVDLFVETEDDCSGESTFEVLEGVPIVAELVAIGPEQREHTRTSSGTPGETNNHQREFYIERRAEGTIAIDGDVDATWLGWLAKGYGSWHLQPNGERSARLMKAASEGLGSTDLLYAEGAWSSEQDHGGRDVNVGAYKTPDGETYVAFEDDIYSYDPERECEIRTIFFGEGPGVLALPPQYGSATVAATLDAVRIVIDDCAGDVDVRFLHDVPITLDGTMPGKISRYRRFYSLIVPGETVLHNKTIITRRAGSGAFQIGDEIFEPAFVAAGEVHQDVSERP